MATSGLYQSKGGGPNDYVFVMGTTEPMRESLCTAMGRHDLLRARYAAAGPRGSRSRRFRLAGPTLNRTTKLGNFYFGTFCGFFNRH